MLFVIVAHLSLLRYYPDCGLQENPLVFDDYSKVKVLHTSRNHDFFARIRNVELANKGDDLETKASEQELGEGRMISEDNLYD